MKNIPPAWLRRTISISCVASAWVLVVSLSPALLLLSLAIDLYRRTPWVVTRFLAYFVVFLSCELAGVAGALLAWVVTLGGALTELSFQLNFKLQKAWGGALFWSLVRIFGIELKVQGRDQLSGSPVLVLARHVSSADSLLPTVFISRPHGIHLRFVMKEMLLWDPCLDIVGNRLPNCFVGRGSSRHEQAVGQVRSLLEGLGPHEGVAIFPEGTRFTPNRRLNTIARFRERGDEEAAQQAESLQAVLPPRKAGVLALLAGNPGADVVFVAHAGLDTVHNVASLMKGSLVGHTIEVEFWRVPWADIPTDDDARMAWIWEHWRKVDAWVMAREPKAV